jgi:hypothetical protein
VLTVLALSIGCSEAKDDVEQMIKSNISHDMATCAAYFLAASEVFEGQLPPEKMNGINSLFLKSTKLSDLLSSEEVTKSRVNMSLNEIIETMQKNPVGGWSVVMNKHDRLCKTLTTEKGLEDRVDYYTQQKILEDSKKRLK